MSRRSDKGGSEELAALLKQRRESTGLSRRELADATGLSYPYISQLETGYRLPSSKAMQMLARALQVDPAEMFGALPQEDLPDSAGSQAQRAPRSRTSPRSQYLANPVHASEPAPSSGRSRREQVHAAVEALEAVPARERLEALNQVQAAVLAGLLDDQRATP